MRLSFLAAFHSDLLRKEKRSKRQRLHGWERRDIRDGGSKNGNRLNARFKAEVRFVGRTCDLFPLA
jgi:hypothetical protein